MEREACRVATGCVVDGEGDAVIVKVPSAVGGDGRGAIDAFSYARR